ncbi:AVAST type 4 anti-phage nuclease Avs4 [Alicyclobacillus fastidiosus]|uniref:ATP-binding protein n=1 Tax=Alicyclobacillus fastidiosus TaxID=392011 RepID=A0ABV5AHZ0_9BACL|nr:AVAST type 4 anti-phage nuclease Avs4 [Alicyclobacillus fastidiosus]WEH09129.1 ATP-binding protein [Alicyclobacillus fastidiosus]
MALVLKLGFNLFIGEITVLALKMESLLLGIGESNIVIAKPDWDVFKAKFSENPQSNFEWLCYLLFCVEFRLPIGIFRYKNQSGIETNPVTQEDDVVGWQAKFYETTLSQHKADLIDMVKKSNRDYPDLTKIVFFTNQEWGQGRLHNDPQVKLDVEEAANKLNIDIEWRTASFFESPFVTTENQLISQYFFSLEKTVIDAITNMREHTEYLLSEIQTTISFDEHKIELDRDELLQNLITDIRQKSMIVLSGEGGVGKTAVIKNLYNVLNDTIPFYMLKANQFDISNIDLLFWGSNLNDFIKAHKDDSEKIFVVDSAEKLVDLNETNPFRRFLSVMIQNEWTLVFTVRSQYLIDLDVLFIDNYQLAPLKFHIDKLSREDLNCIAEEYNFSLPNDYRLLELITNPFYLNEYLKFYTEGDNIGYLKFKELLWNKVIRKAKPSREQCFLQIAFKRANENQFFMTLDSNNSSLESLVEDGILGYQTAGYFITHDIYEEWALERIIESEYIKKESNFNFIQRIGDSLAIRRSFRNWISEKLFLEVDSSKEFVEELIEDDSVASFWKDEAVISVLLCDYSEYFFNSLNRMFLGEHQKLLQRISFLLRIACKEVDNDFFKQMGMKNVDLLSAKYIFTSPKGSGWNGFIKFVYEHLDEIGLENIRFVLPIVHDWSSKFRQGETTRLSGLIALKYYFWLVQRDIHIARSEDTRDKILETILYCTGEIKTELISIFDEVLANKSKDHSSPHYGLIETILTKSFISVEVMKVLPDYVLKLGDLFWFRSCEEIDSFQWSSGVEQYFCIDDQLDSYSPASAYQTPIYWLLQIAFSQTVNFILDFTNKTVECFAKSEFARNEVTTTELYIEDKVYKQYICGRLWNMYRGTEVAPDVLESMHMALEKVLLEAAKNIDAEVLQNWLLYLLKNSKSASITAIVVSVVLAYPGKTFNVAIDLFKSKDLFFHDTQRMIHDQTAKLNYSIGYGVNSNSKLHQDERIGTCSDKHRAKSLENVALEYQFFRTEEVSEEESAQRLQTIWDVFDTHYADLSETSSENERTKTWKLYLARMDRRKMNPTLEEKDGAILISFNPELEPEVREYSEASLKQSSDRMKYTELKLWAHYRIRHEEQYKQYIRYEDNPTLALAESRDIIAEFEKTDDIGNKYDYEAFSSFNHSIPAEVCSVLIRDFANLLTDEDKAFCKETIVNAATSSFRPNYQYQISDGVESAISVLPILIREFPDESDIVKFILLMILFDRHSIGMYADFADFSVNAISKDLWNLSFEDANSILMGYLFLIPKYESIRTKLFEEMRRQSIYRVGQNELVQAFLNEYEMDIQKILDKEIRVHDLGCIGDIESEYLIVAFQLIPLGTNDVGHLQVAQDIISKFATDLMLDKSEDRISYSVQHDFLVKLSHLVLSCDEKYIPLYLAPFVDEKFTDSKIIAELFNQFILAEDSLRTINKFWAVWYFFYHKVIELTKVGEEENWYTGNILKSYLFASVRWKENATEWKTFGEDNKRFFKDITKERGYFPSTLYSLAKLLNGVGSSYLSAGLVWISEMLCNNGGLWKSELYTNTVYYLECILKKHIHENREDIRRRHKHKRDVLIILDFLVERGSVVGYMLRESIL